MEALSQLTRRQLEVLQRVGTLSTPERGAHLNRLATSMKVTPPTALAHLTILERMGLVARFRGKTSLTRKGKVTLDEYLRHHRLAEALFSRSGLSPDEAHVAAKEIDLSLRHETVDKICRTSGHPATCPHGNPIPPCGERKARS